MLNFSNKCLLTSSKGTRNNQGKLCISFWDFLKIPDFFLKKSKKSLKKSNCSKFFEKNKIRFFCWIFHIKCLLTSSMCTRNNQEKLWISFWDILKIPDFFLKKSKKSLKKSNCSKFFEKNKINFFCWIFQICLLISSKGTRNNKKKYCVAFEIFWEYPFFSSKNRKNQIVRNFLSKK